MKRTVEVNMNSQKMTSKDFIIDVDKTKYLSLLSYAYGLSDLEPFIVDTTTTIPEAETIKYFRIIVVRWDRHVKALTNNLTELLTSFKY